MPIPQFKPGQRVDAQTLQQLGDDSTYAIALTAATTDPGLGVGATRDVFVWTNGQAVSVFFNIVFGTSPTAGSGEYFINLPPGLPPAAAMPPLCGVGTVTLTDDSAGAERAAIVSIDPTNTQLRMKDPATQAKVTNAAPWTWAAGDSISGSAHYWTDFEGGTPVTNPTPTFPINTPWPIDQFSTPVVTVGTGGQEFLIPSGSGSMAAFTAALSSMNSTGGNVIRFQAGQHNGEYRVRGTKIAGGSAPSGVAGNHNIITADTGAVITGVQQGASPEPAIDISASDHWDVIGLTIDGSDFSGIRYMHSSGTAGSPCRVYGNTVMNCEHYHIKARGWFASPYAGVEHIDFVGNVIDGGTRSRTVPQFSEGFYFGVGPAPGPPAVPEWVGGATNINCRQNVIRRTQAEAIELKPGCTDIVIEDNLIDSCDLSPPSAQSTPTGHIMVIYANSARPGGDVPANVVVRRNRLYNLTQESGQTRAPIVIGAGGTECYSNLIWDCASPAAVHIDSGAGGMGTGTITVDHNTSDGTMVSNVDSYGSLVQANNIPDQAAATFVGPTTGTADNGQGAGSGFAITSLAGTASGAGRVDATGTNPNSPPDPGALAVV